MSTPDTPGADDGRVLPLVIPGDDETVRVRFPGGRLGPGDWTASARLAAEHGSDLHLTSRGGLRIHGVRDRTLLHERVTAAGLVSDSASRSRPDIIASPLAGRLEGRHEVAGLIAALEDAVLGRSDVRTAGTGILLGLDDGSGDVLPHSPDLAAEVRPGGEAVRFHVAGRDTGVEAATTDAATVMIDAVHAFVHAAEGALRVPTSGGVHDLVVVALTDHAATSVAEHPPTGPSTVVETPTAGWVDTADGLVSLLAVMPHDVVPTRLAGFLGAVERPSTLSPDRVIGLHGLTEGMAEQVVRVLAPMGMVFDAASPWVRGRAPE